MFKQVIICVSTYILKTIFANDNFVYFKTIYCYLILIIVLVNRRLILSKCKKNFILGQCGINMNLL